MEDDCEDDKSSLWWEYQCPKPQNSPSERFFLPPKDLVRVSSRQLTFTQ